MGLLEEACADGSTGCSSSRMSLGDAVKWTSWGDVNTAQRAYKGNSEKSKASCDAGRDV